MAHAQDRPTKLQKIILPISSPGASFLTYYAAQKLGFYREEGFDVEIPIVSGRSLTAGLLGGDFQYVGSAAMGEVGAILKGMKLKMIMSLTDRPAFDFVARSGIRSFNDLKGKIIGSGSFMGSQPDEVIRGVLVKNGLNPDTDVKIVYIGGTPERNAALRAGIVDATLLSDLPTLLAIDDGYVNLGYTGDFMKIVGANVMVTDEHLRKKPEETVRFLRATLKGFWTLRVKKAEVVPLHMEFMKIPDRKTSERLYANAIRIMTENGEIREELMRELIENGKKLFKIGPEKEVKPSEVFDFTYIRRARQDLVAAQWKP
jgi:ABC-type nitrate/sulfonate/bicarbonate transport system substrate-binding protein